MYVYMYVYLYIYRVNLILLLLPIQVYAIHKEICAPAYRASYIYAYLCK